MKKTAYAIIIISTLLQVGCEQRETKSPLQNLVKKEEHDPSIEWDRLMAQAKTSDILNYTVVEKKDISYANTPRMVYRVMLDVADIPLEVQMKKTAAYIWENGNKQWKEFTVFMYLPEMNTQGLALGIGEFRPTGLKEFKIQGSTIIGTKWEEKANQQLEVMSKVASKKRSEMEPVRLTAEMKKKIYREFVNDPLWAIDDGSDKVTLKLADKYMKKYNLTKNELAAICFEGVEKGW